MVLKQQRKTPGAAAAKAPKDTTSSSQVEAMRGVIDVADSSDDRYAVRYNKTGWVTNVVPDLDDLTLNDDDDEENAQMQAGDFDLLSQLPTSFGGHFKFASEKNWDTDSDVPFLDKSEASEYFTLNLKLLNVGLQTIPFYKRMDYASSMFTKQQLTSMDKAAEAAEKQYQKVLQEHESNPKIKANSANSKGKASAKSQLSTNVENKTEKDDELDELLSMTGATVKAADSALNDGEGNKGLAPADAGVTDASAAAVTEDGAGNKDEIQQWLDNVLEE